MCVCVLVCVCVCLCVCVFVCVCLHLLVSEVGTISYRRALKDVCGPNIPRSLACLPNRD